MPAPRRPTVLPAALLASAMALAGCASMEAQGDWWGVQATGAGDAARITSTSHVNHGRPARDAPVEPVLLREARRGAVAIAVYRDAALGDGWADTGPALARELDKALDWLARVAGPAGASLVVTLVDDRHALEAERVHAAAPPVVELYVAAPAVPASRSAVVGRALAKGLHEMVHATASVGGAAARASRFDAERRASLVEACYLAATLRPGDTLSFDAAGAHPATDNFAVLQSRAAAAAVAAELRLAAGDAAISADDRRARDAVGRVCDQAVRSGT